MAACVTNSSFAALVKLKCLADDSNAFNARNGGMLLYFLKIMHGSYGYRINIPCPKHKNNSFVKNMKNPIILLFSKLMNV